MLRQVPRQRPPSGRTAIAVSAAVLAAAAFLPALATSASAQAPGATAGTFAGDDLGSAPAKVLLINGDRLLVTPDPAAPRTAVVSHDSEPLLVNRIGNTTYEIPADALPYLGHGLDPSLFDLSSLEQFESGGRLPVQLTYAGATPSVPGITITRASRGSATGYLTAASARAFGAALARQFAAGHAAGNYSAGGLLAGVSIGLAGAAPLTPVRPDFPMHTVTITAKNEWGKPDSGDEIELFNADNPARFGDPVEAINVFYHGTAKFSVPAGHYWAIAGFYSFFKNAFSSRMVVLPQFTVAGNGTTVRVAAKAASSEVSFKAPRHVYNSIDTWTLVRTSPNGDINTSGTIQFGGSLWISPTTRKPSAGTLRSYTGAELTSSNLSGTLSSPAKGPVYAYNLAFAGPPGLVPSQHFVVTPATLATVHERFSLNQPSQAFVMSLGGNPNQIGAAIAAPFNVPSTNTQYFSGGSGNVWQTIYQANDGAAQADSPHTLRDGAQLTEGWNADPLHPQPDVQLLTGSLADYYPTVPSAFRYGNELYFLPDLFSDNDTRFGHFGGQPFTGTYQISASGRKVRGGGYETYARAQVSPQASVIRFALAATSADPPPLDTLSAQTYTVWTVHSQADPHAALPPSWYCVNLQLDITQHCSVLPLLSLSYQVKGITLAGGAPPGQQSISVAVGHFQPARSTAAITAATAQVSWDGGQYWQPAVVTATGAGHYRVTFTPPAGVDVTLRFWARDAAGNQISETITDAYGVGPAV